MFFESIASRKLCVSPSRSLGCEDSPPRGSDFSRSKGECEESTMASLGRQIEQWSARKLACIDEKRANEEIEESSMLTVENSPRVMKMRTSIPKSKRLVTLEGPAIPRGPAAYIRRSKRTNIPPTELEINFHELSNSLNQMRTFNQKQVDRVHTQDRREFSSSMRVHVRRQFLYGLVLMILVDFRTMPVYAVVPKPVFQALILIDWSVRGCLRADDRRSNTILYALPPPSFGIASRQTKIDIVTPETLRHPLTLCFQQYSAEKVTPPERFTL
ncbi:unnamed protein product [Nesidiocoris tenuis]|uniref:Uncharacterized protein n=1 Tax=Nesidiocoris tenuis TaxID=355587 RepID=A0A6H5HA90_9HEMI|nr:unnamed protein product [Nesidiocoris tenuis]